MSDISWVAWQLLAESSPQAAPAGSDQEKPPSPTPDPMNRPARIYHECPRCEGSGFETLDWVPRGEDGCLECWECDGTGRVKVIRDWLPEMLKRLGL